MCTQYLQIINQQLIQSRVSIKVDQEALVIDHSDARRLQGNAQALQLSLTLLQETRIPFLIHQSIR